MVKTPIRVKLLDFDAEKHDLFLPVRKTAYSSGYDIRTTMDLRIVPGQCAKVPVGFSLEIPPGFEAQIRPRSGISHKYKIIIPNGPATIDSDFRGPIQVLLMNLGEKSRFFPRGTRIAQMVFQAVPEVSVELVSELGNTVRGAGGFGHTGLS